MPRTAENVLCLLGFLDLGCWPVLWAISSGKLGHAYGHLAAWLWLYAGWFLLALLVAVALTWFYFVVGLPLSVAASLCAVFVRSRKAKNTIYSLSLGGLTGYFLALLLHI